MGLLSRKYIVNVLQVSTKVMLESLHQFCEYLLHKADPGEVVAAADHVRNCTQTLLTKTAPDEFTDRILALIASYKTATVPNLVPRRFGSVTSDDKSSDLTDDASAIGSEPGGAVTDLEEEADDECTLFQDECRIGPEGQPPRYHQREQDVRQEGGAAQPSELPQEEEEEEERLEGRTAPPDCIGMQIHVCHLPSPPRGPPSVSISVCLSLCLSVRLSVSLFLSLFSSLSLSLSVCLSLSLHLSVPFPSPSVGAAPVDI